MFVASTTTPNREHHAMSAGPTEMARLERVKAIRIFAIIVPL